ncbi:RDD family protein [Pseudobacteroides cellulosolvens]|uniref:RDD domain containing protein n=1 Tax=Pseudobacteroides cellulosolvens ATCC 35603 = DSM 2933 TaxID=398512 RepID=A0A0L6JH63_9FIRM|nr:RDD family protein [Pseudobacteroides cellulosolvens]KNY25050.1 RDD domain containing protein [Pseudobacteroides cellulosolvens ATCC 35603 = DSM 2933]
MRKIKNIITPENVFIDFELAGLGSRFLAFLIDFMIQCFSIFLIIIMIFSSGFSMYQGEEIDSYITALGIVVVFVIYNGYFIFFEMLMNGQSPGKRLLNLMVIKETGEAITFFDSALRNIIRVIDFLPSFYLAGSLIMVFNKNYKRIGDMAANTIVVKKLKNEKPLTAKDILAGFSMEIKSNGTNIYPVNEYEFNVLKEFMERKEQLGEKKSLFTFYLNRYFHSKFNMEIKGKNPYEFFNEILFMNKDRGK